MLVCWQFRFFFNLYFLVVALTQFIPVLQVGALSLACRLCVIAEILFVHAGFLFTYIAPLAFVLSVTMLKEGYDDFGRYRRDKEANSQVRSACSSAAARAGDVTHASLRPDD